MALYVGFDSSTQSLTATVIEAGSDRPRIIAEQVIAFDSAFPEFGTSHGVLTRPGGTVVAPPLMWAAALEAMMERLREAGIDLAAVRAISGSAQQHGSVYLTARAGSILAALDPARSLVPQLSGALAREVSPVWLDTSTTKECAAIASAVGGDAALARLTGSRAYERFTAAQIRKFAEQDPEGYAATARIHLVSSFLASLLIGGDAPVDPGDASGMNLMDISARQWAPQCVGATAPDLARRLAPIRDSWTVAGRLAPFWQHRFGFGPGKVVAWSGDNPSSLVGLGLIEAGTIGVSLGTSDTVFAPISAPAPDPSGAGHVFGSPAGGYMALTCFANGSLARERIRDQYGLDWASFAAHLKATPPGNDGAMMIPWFVPEITPTIDTPGPHRLQLDPHDARRNVRAVVEGQALAMRLHSRWFVPAVGAIRVTGGAAANTEVLQIIADVFDAEVIRIAPPNAASLGAALRAFHADRASDGQALTWREVVAGFTEPLGRSTVRPRPGAAAVYREMLPRYQQLVDRALISG